MKIKLFITGWCTLLLLQPGHSQTIRAFSQRYHNASVRGNVVYVSNSIISTSGIGSGSPGTGEAPPGGSSRNNTGNGININVAGTSVTLMPFASAWKYFATGATPAGAWTSLGYNDAAWPAGNGELGYGDADEATCVPSGGGGTLCVPTGNKWITTYFRKTVNIPNPALYNSYTFNMRYDDGFVVYVNGVEVARRDMPAGAIVFATTASATNENTAASFSLPNTAFAVGANDISVEIHQVNATSSDISFDMQLIGSDVFNSSTADLNLTSCSSVLWAGLYWGAGQGTDGANTAWITGETTCKLKIPGASSYTTVTSTVTDYHNNTLAPTLVHTGYKCFADITSLINTASPNGTYTVADVLGPVGIGNAYGGWSIVIAYQDPADIIRELNIFDGNVIVDNGQPPINIDLSGFTTPPSGPVSCELGAILYDGDRTSADSFAFKQGGAPAFLDLTPNPTSNTADMWNSTISYKGAVVTSRNPAFQNTLGYDADIIDLPNPGNANFGNNQTSATIRLSSPAENYLVQVVTATISIKEPYIQLRTTSTDVNGGSLLGGDELRYNILYINNGTDSSLNTYVYDTIPVGTTYKTGSLLIGGVPKTDAAGDDEAEYDVINNRVVFRLGSGANAASGGRVISGASGNANFSVYAPNICFVRACSSNITNQSSIYYTGATSGSNFSSRSGALISGCFVANPTSDLVTGSCRSAKDTIITNICPVTTALVPTSSFIGYRFYSAQPFGIATVFNPATPINFTRVIYAYYDGPGICDDTVSINFFIIACPDIDDDNDGIPDYVEMNNPLALGDHDSDGNLNWNDAQYPGYVDNNADGFNDNFDPGGDADNDGVPNFYDVNFPGYVDSNSDGVNDNMDKDLDGIPNHLDLDSDNDGIPDTAESFGVDANGDGIIDNYTDTDNDGFSQNVDANNTGVTNSALGLGALDTDGDGLPNYLDLDSDNDGIPDITEAFGTDAANSARVNVFADSDADGYADTLDADVGNDLVAENSAASILRTGADGNNDGRTDTWPNKNMDADSKPSPYDLDSDGDGIDDVREAQFTDANADGRVDGAINADGRNTALAAMGSLTIPNTDGSQRSNPYDIDSDDDGIPDNVEGLTTLGYSLPAAADTDGDGIDNAYDNFAGFGGNGIAPVDTDGDTIPDYLDPDTDSDGLIDRIEGNDLNFNGQQDDLVTLTGLDTDGDGLDNRFDNNNASAEATSAYMGNGGTTLGDPTPGSTTTVQRTIVAFGCVFERDWRCLPYVLSCEFISFKAILQSQRVKLDWTALCRQEVDYFIVERSTDRVNFSQVVTTPGKPVLNETQAYSAADDVTGVTANLIYYRLKSVMKSGRIILSNIIPVKRSSNEEMELKILPNPVTTQLQLLINATENGLCEISIIDGKGRLVYNYKEYLLKGASTITYQQAANLADGIYYVRVTMGERTVRQKFNKLK